MNAMDELKIKAIAKAMELFTEVNVTNFAETIVRMNQILEEVYEAGFENGFRKKIKVS